MRPAAQPRPDEARASKLIEEAQRDAIARGEGFVLTFAEHAHAVLHNALGHYETALDNAQRASAQDELHASVWSLPELVEAAVRSGKPELGHCRVTLDLARAHLLYGEWLRRRGRRIDAREQLRAARASFAEMGAEAFAQRAIRELLATGETVRKRTVETRDELTPHEARIARMARDCASNRDIATQLFVSRKTVEYHLHKVFTKLGISSRQQLERVLARG